MNFPFQTLTRVSLLVLCLSLSVTAQTTSYFSQPTTKQDSLQRFSKDSLRYRSNWKPAGLTLYAKGGLTQFYGELNTQKMSGLFGMGIEKRMSRVLTLALDLEGGNLQGSKKDFYNSRFRTDFGQLNAIGKLNLTQFFRKKHYSDEQQRDFRKQGYSYYEIAQLDSILNHRNWFRRLNFYVYGGIGTMRFNAIAYDLTTNVVQRYTSDFGSYGPGSSHTGFWAKYDDGSTKRGIYYTRERTIPLGLQLTYDLTPKVELGIDYRYTLVRNDKLDATAGRNNATIADGLYNTTWGANSYSNTPNDKWGYLAVRLGLRLGKTKRDDDGDGIENDRDVCPTLFGTRLTNGCPDYDGDGIKDSKDNCPDKKGNIEANGCPDSDGDGVLDSEDPCPNRYGKFGGCPDTDGDGIIDSKDGCPNEKGTVANNGCPDTDGDGVIDSKDACPDRKGPASQKGCPDTDGDGIIDADDNCPTVAGSIDGCPDTDKDGIIDSKDACPDVFGSPYKEGCPEINTEQKALIQEKVATFARLIQFESSRAVLTRESNRVVEDLRQFMAEYPNTRFMIEGHTDNMGGAESNRLLSERRAKAVRDYLVSKGIDGSRLEAAGYGSDVPVAENSSPAGRAMNRRVEIKLLN